MGMARKRSNGMSSGEWAVVIGGFSVLLVGLGLVVVVASRLRSPETYVAQASVSAPSSPTVAANSAAPAMPVYTPPPRPDGSLESGAQRNEGEVVELVAQRLERQPSDSPTTSSDRAPSHGGNVIFGLMVGLAGLFSICGAAFDWDFFMNSRKARAQVWLFGRQGARVFYVLLGLAFVIVGLLVGVGVISPESLQFLQRRRY